MGKLQQTVSIMNDADQLRNLIATCEKIRSFDVPDNTREYLTALHAAHRMAVSLQAQYLDIDLRAEDARLAALDEQILRYAKTAIGSLGGQPAFAEFRAQSGATAGDRWWQLDERVALERRHTRNRFLTLLGVLAAIALAAFLARDILFPYNPVGDAVNAAGTQIDARNLPAAIAEIDTGLKKVPTSTELLIWKGILLGQVGDATGAATVFGQARAQSKSDSEFYLTRAQAYIRVGQYDQVIQDSNALLATKPDSAEAYYLRSTGYEGLGDQMHAMMDLDQCSALAQASGNDALYAMSRYRYAMLMQAYSGPPTTQTAAP